MENNAHFFHAAISHPVLRKWQANENVLSPSSLVYPVFLCEDPDAVEPVASLPGIARYGVKRVVAHLEPLVKRGLECVLLFGVVSDARKTPEGLAASAADSPVVLGVQAIRAAFPDLLVACDVCLCHYTTHGHCGVLNAHDMIDNERSISRLAAVSVDYARAGAHVIAPSDMMDSRVAAIKQGLAAAGLGSAVAVMSYSAKFASAFYGPFRAVAGSAPSAGHSDRRAYQLPPVSRGLARRATARDVAQGADMLMVKPGGPYLDIVRDVREAFPDHPLAVYQVGGEYASLYFAAQHGVFSLQAGVLESVRAFFRAGANIVITYFAPQILEWLAEA